MTAPFGGFPGSMPGTGFGAPAAPQQAAVGFVLNMPADPNWEPMQSSDTLEKDGYYAARITGEKPRDSDGKPQLIITVEILDQDAAGKVLAKFMPHSETTQKNTWFLWRGLIRSITGQTATGKAALQYTPGMFTNQIVYFKTEPYLSKDGSVTTSIGDWVTKADWEEAVRSNRHRWVSKTPQSMGGAGALPGGVPGFGGGMPGLPAAPGQMPGGPAFPGLPGAPGAAVPQPTGMPMQQPVAPPAPQMQVAPGIQVAPPAPQMQVAPGIQVAPPFAPPVAPTAPAWPQPPQVQAPQAVAPMPSNPFAAMPGANGAVPAPAPTAASIAASFPGLPGQPR